MVIKFSQLTDNDLMRIFNRFVKDKHKVVCNKPHVHGIECIDFDDEQTMIIERLRIEVVLLRAKQKEIADILKK